MSENILIFNNKENVVSEILKSYGVHASKIFLKEEENFDVYDIRLRKGTRHTKLNRILIDVGMQLGSYSTPIGRPVVSEGIYRMSVQRKEIDSVGFEDLLVKMIDICGNDSDYYCPIIMGVDYKNFPFIIDINRLPNLLVGGIPGSGKSMLLHSIILSAIHNKSRIYLADPKMVEFSYYNNIDNISNISYSYQEHFDTTNMLIEIMEERFRILKKFRSRNIIEHNKKNKNKMSPICFVIDEWADIFLQNKKIQDPLCKLAQKGRAAGISVILATQRPSSDVISGLVKASFPGRVALKTSSMVDSRVILDESGAESLTDIGVGLYKDHRNIVPMVFRTSIISDLEDSINRVGSKSIFNKLFG